MTSTNDFRIRKATESDAPALLAVYAPYVRHTAITFEYDVPTVEEFRRRIADIGSSHPYLVAEDAQGEVLGYAYAHQLGERAAFQWAVETSIYVDLQHRHRGIGHILQHALENELRSQGIKRMYACIAYTEPADEYLTHDSIQFHAREGFTQAGHLHRCGKKFDRWYDLIWMEKDPA